MGVRGIVFVACVWCWAGLSQAAFVPLETAGTSLNSRTSVKVSQFCQDEFGCRSSLNETSCLAADVCSQVHTCSGRADYPQVEYPLQDWEPSSEHLGCTVSDQLTSAPPPTTSRHDSNRILVVNGSADGLSACFSKRNSSTGPVFTLVAWLKADCGNCSVVELFQVGAASIHIRAIRNSLCVDIDCVEDPLVDLRVWNLLTIRVITGRLQVFLGDVLKNFTSDVMDAVDIQNVYVGSSEIASLDDLYHLYDVRFYIDALTSREIQHLKTGLWDSFVPEESCRCPASHPDLDATFDTQCTNGSSLYPRFFTSVKFNQPDVLVDETITSKWASAEQGAVTLMLNLTLSYQIDIIEIEFDSDPPSAISCTFISDGVVTATNLFVCVGKKCQLNWGTLDIAATVGDYKEQTADGINLVLQRESNSDIRSFVLSKVSIIGRCDCYGNARTCAMTEDAYTCDCLPETNTQNYGCTSCTNNFYRKSSDFDCPHTCNCNNEGVADSTDQCNQDGGVCKCKEHVHGLTCDTCNIWTHSLGSSTTTGCTECNCYIPGTSICINTTGECVCKANTRVPRCDVCKDNNFGLDSSDGCQPCSCDPAGTVNQDLKCHDVTGQCTCKQNVEGRQCNVCKSGFYQLETANLQGCTSCDCHKVGMEYGACQHETGQCPCRGGVVTDRTCTPQIDAVSPLFGPQVGNTPVTISGKLLGNSTHGVSVFLGDKLQNLLSVQDDEIVVLTLAYNTSGQNNLPLKLSWTDVDSPIDSGTTFSYLPDPYIDTSMATDISTFVSGGCIVKLYGLNLKSVANPRLEITNVATPTNTTHGICRHIESYVTCMTPDLKGYYSTPNDQFLMTAVLDGVVSSNIGNIAVVPDPVINDMGTVEFQYPFESTITITGQNLRKACQSNDYTVLIGVSHCTVTHISDSSIECEPPTSAPDGKDQHVLEVSIGNIKKVVGTFKYLEFYETKGFIIIISCIAAVILIIIGAIVILCCCRYRRRHKPSKPLDNVDSKGLVATKKRPMNNYSELTTVVNAPPTSNGHNTLVHAESIFKEPKKGIVNTSAEDSVLIEEFLPRVDPGLQEDIRLCYIGSGHFNIGQVMLIKGKHVCLTDGSVNNSGQLIQKLSIKSLVDPLLGREASELPPWASQALSECLRFRKHKHTHTLNIFGIGVDKQRFHILYPHMAQGTLKAMVSNTSKDFSVRQLLAFGQQVAEGAVFLASKDITHKDIAARNCLVDDISVVKLGDASFSWDLYKDEYVYNAQRERYLPLRWMAPESISDGYYDMRTDVWSFAVLVWELLTRGCLPFHEVVDSEKVSDFILQGYILGKPDTLSDEVYDLLRNCWSPDNEVRPSIATVSKLLSDILDGEDEDTYANTGLVGSFMDQPSSGKAATPRPPNDNIYSSAALSRV